MISERWKYQIKIGLIWGICLSLFMSSLDFFYASFETSFLTFAVLKRTLIFIALGIFFVGYMRWKTKNRKTRR